MTENDNNLECGLHHLERQAMGGDKCAGAVLAEVRRLRSELAACQERERGLREALEQYAERDNWHYGDGADNLWRGSVDGGWALAQPALAAAGVQHDAPSIFPSNDFDNMPEAEIDGILRSAGLDPDAVARRMQQVADDAIRIASLEAEVKHLREQLEQAVESHKGTGRLLDRVTKANEGFAAAFDELRAENARLKERLEQQQIEFDGRRKKLLAQCANCGQIVRREDRDHWRKCPSHPARVEVERLRSELAEANSKLATSEARVEDWQQRGRVSDIHVLHDPLITEALSALGEDDE